MNGPVGFTTQGIRAEDCRPRSAAGDHVDLRAEIDFIIIDVGLPQDIIAIQLTHTPATLHFVLEPDA
jgi:hypothetical protein